MWTSYLEKWNTPYRIITVAGVLFMTRVLGWSLAYPADQQETDTQDFHQAEKCKATV